jgi:DNA polymerase
MAKRRAAVVAAVVQDAPVPEPASTPAPTPALPVDQPADRAASLAAVAAELQGCTRCKLCETRKTIVVGEGNPQAELVFVGEGPGEQEDLQGRPFVGKAGQLLDRMIEAMGLTREQVYICNVVKCRPPGNRNPEPDEIEACSPFLQRQLEILKPKVVVALGKFAAQRLLQTETPITRLRGSFKPYRGAKLMPTYHPAYLLRNPDSKREAWADLQAVARELGIALPVKRT